jgi:hypothetical protein
VRCLWNNVGKYCRGGQATDNNIIRRMRIACRITNALLTLTVFTTLVTRTRLIVTLYVHCLVSYKRGIFIGTEQMLADTRNARTVDPSLLPVCRMGNMKIHLTRENGFWRPLAVWCFCEWWRVGSPSQTKWSGTIPIIACTEKCNYVVMVVRQLLSCSTEITSCLIAFWKMKSNVYV